MANCPKCSLTVEQPLKTWKIKQTPIALYECPSCKVRWRNKTTEAAVVNPEKPPETPTTSGTEVETPSIPVASTVAAAPRMSEGPFAGIRRLFSSIFSL